MIATPLRAICLGDVVRPLQPVRLQVRGVKCLIGGSPCMGQAFR